MKFALQALVTASCLMAAALSAPAPASAEDLQTFVAGFITDFDNLDWPRFRARFSDDSTVFLPPQYGAALSAGRAETDAAWQRVFASIKAASKASAPPYMRLDPRDVHIQQWPGGAVVTFVLGGGDAPLNRRTLVLRQMGSSFEIVHLHGSTIPKGN